MDRSNGKWIEHLRSGGAAGDDALSDLRMLLISGLRRSFLQRDGVDGSFLEDLAQETLVKVLKSLDQFEGRCRFTTWAMSIGIRLAFSELRRRHWRDVSLDHVLEGAGDIPQAAVRSGAGPALAAQQKSLIEELYRVIHHDLSKKQREALLAELKGMPQEEIGRRMGSNRNAIYKLTHDARKRLKAGLDASGYTVADIQAAFGW